jgi:hypothetical protein
MSGSTDGLGFARESNRTMLALARWEAPSSTRRSPAANLLIAPPCELVLPRLDAVPVEHRFLSDDRELLALAEILVRSNIATAEDWEQSGRDATKYLSLSLQRWMREHGAAAIDRRFDLDLTLSDRLVDYSDQRGPEGTLYLILDPDGAAFVLLKPTLELLETVHPRLPSTFFMHLAGSLNRWVRVYDYRDAEEHVDMLREWYEGEEDRDQYEVPDVEGCTPECLKEPALSFRSLKELARGIGDPEVQALIQGLLDLCRVASRAKRLDFTDDMGEQLMDANPPLPCLLAAFTQGDAVVGCFDDEAQTAMETTPHPNLIIPLQLSNPSNVRQGLRTLAVACETLAAASRLIELMPGNDDGVITREGQP